MRERSRSRSPLCADLTVEAREAVLAEFARLFWVAPDAPDEPPWSGKRAAQVTRFRERLVAQATSACVDLDLDPDTGYQALSKSTVVRWQRFTFFEDLARMSDVLFRGPIEPRHGDDVDLRLLSAWRRLRATVFDFEDFVEVVSEFRVSAVRVAMMLETARPPEANNIDGHFELPDARTLACLLSLRCEKDDPEELLEMYRLVCQKMHGDTCTWCGQPFDEQSSAGLFSVSETLVVPATVPKLFVAQCGHAVHTLCFGSQLVPDHSGEARGLCRRCGLPYMWSSIDLDPMINAFCLLFGAYVEKRVKEMCVIGEVSHSAIMSIAEVCQALSQELGGLVSPASAWVLLTKRHGFEDPEQVLAINDLVLKLLLPSDSEPLQLEEMNGGVVGPDDRSDIESMREEDKHLTEVFLPDPELNDLERDSPHSFPEVEPEPLA